MSRSTLAIASLLLAAPALWADDDLTRFVDRNRIAAQKLTADVDLGISQSRVLERGDPADAQQLLERLLGQVQDSQALAKDDRTRLTQQLQARLRQVGETVRVRRIADAEAAAKADPNRPRLQAQPSGQTGPSSVARDFIEGRTSQIETAARLKADRERGLSNVMSGIQNSAVATDAPLTLAKNWKELSDLRKKTVGPQLSEREVALLKALNSTISVDFKETSFKDALAWLNDKTGIALIPDGPSLKDAMVDYDDPVTFSAKKVTVRTVLRKILGDRNLAYILQEGTVQIVTAQRARETMVVRTYPVSDIVSAGQATLFYGPLVARIQMAANAQTLIQTIQSSVEPNMWNINGGPASIQFYEPNHTLIIRASAEMHYSLGSQMFGR